MVLEYDKCLFHFCYRKTIVEYYRYIYLQSNNIVEKRIEKSNFNYLYISIVNVDSLLTYEMKSGIPVTILKTLSFHFVHLVPVLFAAIRVVRLHTRANVFNSLPRGRRELELYATADPGVRLLTPYCA